MPKYRIGGEVTVTGRFEVELPENEIERYVIKLERSPADVLQMFSDGAFEADSAELDDIAIEKKPGKFAAVFFD